MKVNELPQNLCIFEDDRFPNFFPLSLDESVFDLRIGTQTLRKRLVYEINPENLLLVCRPYMAAVLAEKEGSGEEESSILVNDVPDQETLFLNGRLLAYGDELDELLSGLEGDVIVHKKGIAVAARLPGDKASSFAEYIREEIADGRMESAVKEIMSASSNSNARSGKDQDAEGEISKTGKLEKWANENDIMLKETGVRLVSQNWQLIGENGKCIVDDFQKNPLRGTAPESELFKGVELINEEDVVIGSEVEVRSGTVLDASEGPIIIADGARIEPNAIIYGPCFIGERSIVRGGAKIGRETSIGRECRVGGEVSETILAAYSNKQHEGFLGHCYIGSWVNIGAGSCNSDLKNNYGQVSAWSAGRVRETGRRFLGAVIGDHSKVAVTTRFNTGTVIGFNANVTMVDFPPKFVPSFTWLIEPEFVEQDLKKAVQTAQIMMDRRNVPFPGVLGDLFKTIYRYSRRSGHTI